MTRFIKFLPLLILFVGLLASCSTENPDAVYGPHSDDWLLPTEHAASAIANNPPCFDCHAQTVAEGGASPACQECHTAGDPLIVLNCSSCHNSPPDDLSPQGANQPNTAGNHAGHVAFTYTTTTCHACHAMGGTGSLSHFDRIDQTTPNYPADVIFMANYHAKSGAAAGYNTTNQTCSNVTCHGGQTSPDWTSGNINVTNDCISCHQLASVSDQYNSYKSGGHSSHAEAGGYADNLGYSPTCAACHNATALPASGHFDTLDTPAMEGDSANTLISGLNYDNTTNPANPTCTTNLSNCHPGETRAWGAPHPVDDSYRASTEHGPDAKLNLADCQGCHAIPLSGGTNPQFTVDIIQNKLSSAFPAQDITASGCMKCHNDDTAHPSVPGRDNVRWYDAAADNFNVTHNNAGANVAATLNATCGLCHPGLVGSVGSVGFNCQYCHVSNPAGDAVGTCTSCHNRPPSGNSAPNRQGSHNKSDHRLACNVCHTNNGPDGTAAAADHFTFPPTSQDFARADLRTSPNTSPQNMTITPTSNNVTCNGSCHGEGHGNEQWY